MKIEFTASRELLELGRTVTAGETLESSDTIPEQLLQAYVDNGIAETVPPPTPPKIGGESSTHNTLGGEESWPLNNM